MAGMIHIHLPAEVDGNETAVAWSLDEAGSFTGTRLGTLAEAAEAAAGRRTVVFVPTEEVTLTRVSVPTQNTQRLRRAVPYALEEQLASEVEALHFALGPRDADGTVSVAVVARRRMEAWSEALAAAGLNPHLMLPDVLVLPPSTPALFVDDSRALLRTGPCAGVTLPADSLDALLPIALANIETPAELLFIDCRAEPSAPLLPEGITLVNRACGGGFLALAAGRGSDPLNLLQGTYSRRERLGKIWRPWVPTAAVALILLLLQAGLNLGTYFELRSQEQLLLAQAQRIYTETFPDAQPRQFPKMYMEQRLREMQRGGGSGFTPLLARAAPVIAESNRTVIRGMRYNDGELELDLELANLQQLDALKQALEALGLLTDIQSASASDNRVESRIRIREAA